MEARAKLDLICLHGQASVFVMAGRTAGGSWTEWRQVLDQARVRAAARGAAKQQLLFVDQGVQHVLLSVVVVDLQEGQHCDAEPAEPRSPQTELKQEIFMLRG